MDKTCRDIIALNLIPGLGPRKIMSLLGAVRETEEIFRMSSSRMIEIAGKRFDGIDRIRTIRNSREYAMELAYMEKEGIHPLCHGDKTYPGSLRNIYDPPPVLYRKGDPRPCDANAVAIVGSRRCSLYGLQMAERLAFDLAERGITVVSGMARGIDSAAHRGALKARGRTIAVMGSGFRHVYPPESKKLARAISESGAVLTEYSSDTLPLRGNFPQRNRIISGMSMGVVVVEAARKSGAMITVNLALEQGKEVFAVPGRADISTSGGTNLLIQNGAKLVTGVDDILEELDTRARAAPSVEAEGPARHGALDKGGEGSGILEMLDAEVPAHIDSISERAGVDPGKLPELLLKLEMKGLVKALPGGNYLLVNTDRKGAAHAS